MVHHIDLSVTDITLSRTFYDAVLGFMGYARSEDYPHGSDWDRIGEPFHSIGITTSTGNNAQRPHDRYAPGLHHLAWTAESPADVDALHALLNSIGAEILDPPAYYPQYGSGYYALFFADPDGTQT